MDKVEKVVSGLEYCMQGSIGCHMGCPYVDEPACRQQLCRDALEALRPRLMTLKEVVVHYSLPPDFVNDPGAQEDYYKDIQPLYFEFPHDKDDLWNVHWRGYAQVERYLTEWRHLYNQTWRCWTSKPSNEQKEATAWN